MIHNDLAVRLLAFFGAVFALVGSSDDPITEPKLWLTGIAAGCAAVLAIMRAVGQSAPPPPSPPKESGRG